MSSAFIQRGLKPVITHASSRTEAWELGGGPLRGARGITRHACTSSAPALRTSMCNRCVKYGLGKSTQNHTHNYTKTANRHTGLAAIVISGLCAYCYTASLSAPLYCIFFSTSAPYGSFGSARRIGALVAMLWDSCL